MEEEDKGCFSTSRFRFQPQHLIEARQRLGYEEPKQTICFNPIKYQIISKNTSVVLIYAICESHCCTYSNGDDWNLIWISNNVSDDRIKELQLRSDQKLCHFPRTEQLTKKNLLFVNLSQMGNRLGEECDFIPPTFCLPEQHQEASEAISRDNSCWIRKPTDSSQGRGIEILSKHKKLNPEKQCVISRYVDNPLLINGFKFDCRIYVLVTSFDPLEIYLYNEGLTRFATEKYRSATLTKNRFVHLTNYSVNKLNEGKFFQNIDANQDDYGSKWSLSALIRHLKECQIDSDGIMKRIENIIIKSFQCIEQHVRESGFDTSPSGPFFEMFGFDVMIDDQLKPWLIEINLSPSLDCDSPLDLKIKTSLICDLFNIIGLGSIKDENAPRRIHEDEGLRGGWNRIYPSETLSADFF